MIVGTAGHIDHGKTALIRALTGVDTDRLPEEKRRGMTIDLGFAYRTVSAPDDATDERVLGFVDVPGHERFVHNMLAGATGIDFVLLVVAADDGPMPQTREHLEILSLLGLDRGIVALTKADLVSPERLEEAASKVREMLAGCPLQDSEIVPVSSVTGEGIAALEAQLTMAALNCGEHRVQGEFRLAIDRSFVLAGVGVVVTGTVAAGTVSVGDRAMLTPSGIEVRIRGIHAHNRAASTGRAGERCALNLAGAQVNRERVRRGDWVVAPSLHAPTNRLDVGLRLLCHDGKPLVGGIGVHLHLGTARTGARLFPLAREIPTPGAMVPARLVLEQAIGALCGDRLILRNTSASRTIGGGVVRDPYPPARGWRRPERLAALAALAMPRPVAALTELLRISPAGVDLDRFALAAGMTPREAQGAWRETGARVLKAEGHQYGFALAPSRCEALLKEVRAALTAYHQTAPESPGLELDRLRLALAERLPPPLFRALVKALVEDGTLAVRGASIHLPGHAAALPEFEQRLWVRVRLRLEESGFDPSWVRDLARELSVPERAMRQLMKRLARMGEVIEVAPDRFYRRHTVHQMASMLADMCATATNGTVTAAEFRDRIAIGRKLAIIILEYFDRTGGTIRHGDLRKVRPERACVSAPNWDPIRARAPPVGSPRSASITDRRRSGPH